MRQRQSNSINTRQIAALFGACGIILGAFGAHALKNKLEINHSIDTWETAVLYHLIHSVAILFIADRNFRFQRAIAWLWSGGILLFSGSLYLLSSLQWKSMGPITPIGGLLFIIGWALLLAPQKSD